MQVIENDLIKEKVYIKKLKNGLTMMYSTRWSGAFFRT